MNNSIRGKNTHFSKHNRISLKKDFESIFKTGERLKCSSFTLVISPAQHKESRLGIRINKKIGNAVSRNKIKRRLKEIFRLTMHSFIETIDIVIIPYTPIRKKSYLEIRKEFLNLINKYSSH